MQPKELMNSMADQDEKQAFFSSGNIDLKYMEIGICLDKIDRMKPGTHPFCIPVLTPEMNKTKPTEETIVQKSKTNIETENAGAVELSNIKVTNNVMIEIPRELVCLPYPIYHIDGTITFHSDDGDIIIDGDSHMAGTGYISHPGGTFNVMGITEGPITNIEVREAHVEGILTTRLHDCNRYIPKGSKWLIAFIGGDSCMPRVICHLPDDYSQGQHEKPWSCEEGHTRP